MLDNSISYSYEQLYEAVRERLTPATILSDFKEYTSGAGMYGFFFNVSKNLSQLRCFYGLFDMNFVYDDIPNGYPKIKNTVSIHKNTDYELETPYFFAHKGEEYVFDILALNYDYEHEEFIPDILIAAVLLQIQQEIRYDYMQSRSELLSFPSNFLYGILYPFIEEAKARFEKYETKWWSPSCKYIIPLRKAMCNINAAESLTYGEYAEAVENIITSDVNLTADHIIEIYKNIFKDRFVCVARLGDTSFLFDYYKKYANFEREINEILLLGDEEIKACPAITIRQLQSLYTRISNIEKDLWYPKNMPDTEFLNLARENHKDKFPRKKSELLKTVEEAYIKVYNVIKADPSIDLTMVMAT